MSQWVRLCGKAEAPAEGQLVEIDVEGVSICLARSEGNFSALSNWCPHRRAPLGQGWIDGGAVVCPWHSWSFNLDTGLSVYPANESVERFPLKLDGDQILIDLE